MSKITSLLALISLSFVLTGCFDWLDRSKNSVAAMPSESAIGSAQFSGAASAVNKVTGILITWPAVADTSLVKAYKIYRVSGSKKVLLSTVASSLTSFMDGTVTWGTIYTYQVNAVDQKNVEDSNTKTVKALSWAGIGAVTATSRTALSVRFDNISTVIDEIRIYGQTAVGGTKTLLATTTGTDTDVDLTGLRTGFPYIISAQAYVSSLGKEDGNDVTFKTSTLTYGYDYDGVANPQWGNVMLVRAFGEAPGAPSHPSEIYKSPTNRQVELVFNAYSTQAPTAKYVVTRAAQGAVMDSSTTATCTNTTTSACLVCNDVSASSGTVTCRDLDVGPSPTKYRYSLSLVHTDTVTTDRWVEPLPTSTVSLDKVSVLVPIPPKNMVLVHRDAANYEMCQQMNKSSDPLNHNRCIYTGVAAVPYNSGGNNPALTFDPGFYDFGYNLFVDRWETSCNWTMTSQGGMCETRSSPGDAPIAGNCIGQSAPTNTQGKVGDVFYTMTVDGGHCYRATAYSIGAGTTWTSLAASTVLVDGADQIRAMTTIDPGYYDANGVLNPNLPGKRGKITNAVNVYHGAATCATQTDPNYGVKRIGRQREMMVYSGAALMTGELYAFPNINSWYQVHSGTNSHVTVKGCDSYGTVPDALPSTFVDMLDTSVNNPYREMMKLDISGTTYGSRRYMTGASATIDCESRYGVQEPWARKFQSDMLYYSGTAVTPVTTVGIQSPLDNGNMDLLYSITGASTGFVFENSKFSGGALSYGNSNFTGYIVPLGLPITATSYSSTYIAKSQVTGVGTVNPAYTASTTSGAGLRSLLSSGRYYSRVDFSPTDNYPNAGEIRCVLPAE
ncbi:hypothetical protein [Bdellovibrio sp. HCB209]|uniref:hypothetical protein n=1 Tax=Bdellovibrio sp. HCB209 TaxID=3394354 RepID=UPI0039B5FDEB